MAETLRVLAVDDEPLALRRVELLAQRIPGIDLVGKAATGPDALLCIAESKPDVLLLDIKMAGMTGFDLIDKI
jgi:YesN/AraC family two-component response regulator